MRYEKGSGITLVVPFTPGVSEDRDRIWKWLRAYWEHSLPEAKIVMGRDFAHSGPFSKTAAVNDAAACARGDILVILDADAYVSASLITECAREIRFARKAGRRLWFVPYRRFYRVGFSTTQRVLSSDPRHPWHLPDPPSRRDLDPAHGESPRYGHHYAAMITVLPREAFEEVGGMDPRFAGWGGEDISFMRAVDTIYSPHKTCDRSVFHLYHGTIGSGVDRQWTGQTERMPFAHLGARYHAAMGDRERMLKLTREWRLGN